MWLNNCTIQLPHKRAVDWNFMDTWDPTEYCIKLEKLIVFLIIYLYISLIYIPIYIEIYIKIPNT